MKATNTFGVQVIIRMNKLSDGLAPIRARITVDGQRVEISLRKSINPENWDRIKGAAKGKTPEVRSINTYLDQVRNRIFECYQELKMKKQLITAEAIKNLYCGEGEKEHTLLSIFDYHNTEMKSTLEWGTLKNYFTTRRYIEEFIKSHLKTSDVYLAQLNYKFLTDFERFVKSYVPKDSKLTCGQNTTMKHIERLRKVVNMAVKTIGWRKTLSKSSNLHLPVPPVNSLHPKN